MNVKSGSESANIYIDGFNLYHGIKDTGRRDLLWFHLPKLIRAFKLPFVRINKIKYFTATPIHKPQPTLSRYRLWIKILNNTKPKIQIIKGKYRSWQKIEKMTDVNIAVEMLMDAYSETDPAKYYYVISGDTDLIPAIQALKRTPFKPNVVAVFPPERYSKDVAFAAEKTLQITIEQLEQSLLSDPYILSSGAEIHKPESWCDCPEI